MQPVVLRAEGLGKVYRLYESPRARLFSLLGATGHFREHWALRDVSFTLARGQCLGLIGDNGAGKSTLLKLVAGSLQASCGLLERQGRVTAILELGAGFHPEFTGRENLYFGGALIGISEREMNALEPSIVQFAELEDAIDRPVKTYSSGMVVRLAFALVTAVEPKVLIIDEALAVGDQHFQKKCVERIESFRSNGCTILFCSHSLYHIRHLCDVAIWLDGGRVRARGPTEGVLAAYEAHVRAQDQDGRGSLPAASAQPARSGRQAAIESFVLVGAEGDGALEGPDLAMEIEVRMPGDEVPQIGIMLEQVNGVGITSVGTHVDGVTARRSGAGTWRIGLCFPGLPLHSGEYVLSAYLFDTAGLVVYDEWLHHLRFTWVDPDSTPGLLRLAHTWC
ncbi:ABC transporter ATP-binding protein [Thauera sp. WH-2]|jgi:lipopolysaccharide transport system ATP-binding protein|uniref:ABC transporter ATP-binding protein n=1 Tax=Thauera sp. WH-2 TaxID=3401574 RepID=UPI003AAB34B1